MRKIYDCFIFFNELDLLELRFKETYDYVDHYVIVESDKTFTGNPKPFYLEEHRARYQQFWDKVIYVKVTDMPTAQGAWQSEFHQRNEIERGLVDAGPDDVIIVSDCDELIRPRTYEVLRNDSNKILWICQLSTFYFKFNYLMTSPSVYHPKPMAVVKREFRGAQGLRNMMVSMANYQPYNFNLGQVATIQHSGWHFTYLGDTAHAATKLLNFAHTESQHWASKIDVNEIITRKGGIDPNNSAERFEYVKIDEYFPKELQHNPERWKDYVLPNGTKIMKEFVPALDIEEIYK